MGPHGGGYPGGLQYIFFDLQGGGSISGSGEIFAILETWGVLVGSWWAGSGFLSLCDVDLVTRKSSFSDFKTCQV